LIASAIYSPYIVRSGEAKIHYKPAKSNGWAAVKIFSDTAGFAYNAIEENVKDKIDHGRRETGLDTGDAKICR
jgi:type II secretory pathway component PulK